MGGGTVRAIARIKSSEMTPGPLGIEDTSPMASAPASIAVRASSALLMQHTLTRTRFTSVGRSMLARASQRSKLLAFFEVFFDFRACPPDRLELLAREQRELIRAMR